MKKNAFLYKKRIINHFLLFPELGPILSYTSLNRNVKSSNSFQRIERNPVR